MHYLYHPEDRADWVAVHPRLAKGKSREQIIRDLRKDFSGIEVWFSDLDGSDISSQARSIAFDRFFSRFWKDERYRAWTFRCAQRYLKEEPSPYGEMWKEYITLFLRDRDNLLRIHEMYTPEKIRSSLFPGVRDFYTTIIPQAQKYYVTRNIYLIAKFFAKELGFSDVHIFAEEHCKGRRVQEFIESNSFTKYGCSGDSKDDEEMHDILKFYEGKKKIEYSRTLFLASHKYLPHQDFDLNISRNRKGLVQLLTTG